MLVPGRHCQPPQDTSIPSSSMVQLSRAGSGQHWLARNRPGPTVSQTALLAHPLGRLLLCV